VDLTLSNGLWVSNEMRLDERFRQRALELRAKAQNLDFTRGERVRQAINSWVQDRTRDKIRDLVPSGYHIQLFPYSHVHTSVASYLTCLRGDSVISPESPLLITNAIYFKGGCHSAMGI
jgi:serine protease inhibitor